mgnify:CR=1 FL=1
MAPDQTSPKWSEILDRAAEIGQRRASQTKPYRPLRFPVIYDPARRNRGRTLYYLLDIDTARAVAGADAKELALKFRDEYIAQHTGPETKGYRHPVYAHMWRGQLARFMYWLRGSRS